MMSSYKVTNMTFHRELLRQVREKVGLSQRDASREAGLGEHSVHRWEIGKEEPVISNIAKVAEVLDVSLDYLTGRTIDPKSHKGVQGLTPDERQFLNALRRKDYPTAFRMLGEKIDQHLSEKSNISGTSPTPDK
jgi:transcriptional regulator with XRE-family HTH domain